MLRDYLALANTKCLIEVSQLDQISICRPQLAASDQHSTLKLQDSHFARLSGEVVEVFACPKIEAILRVAKHCYQDIPITVKDQPADEDLFIDTRVLLLSAHAAGNFPFE